MPTLPVKSAVKEHPVEVVLGTVVVGLICGWLVSGKKKGQTVAQSPGNSSRSDLDSSAFLQLVAYGRAAGMSEEEALAKALAVTQPSSPHAAPRSRSTLLDVLGDQAIGVVETLFKTVLSVVAREAGEWLRETVRRDKPPSSQ